MTWVGMCQSLLRAGLAADQVPSPSKEVKTYHANMTPPVVRPNKKPAELTENNTQPSQSNLLSFSITFPGIWACFRKRVTKSMPSPTIGRLIQNIHVHDSSLVSFAVHSAAGKDRRTTFWAKPAPIRGPVAVPRPHMLLTMLNQVPRWASGTRSEMSIFCQCQ